MNDRPQPGRHHPYYASMERDNNALSPSLLAGAPPPTRRRAFQFLPVTLGTLAGVVLVIVAAMILSHQSGTTQTAAVAPTARQICGDLTTQQYNDLYGLLSRTQKTIGTGDQFAAAQRQLDAQLGTVHTCTYNVTGQDATSATLTLRLTRGSSPAVAAQMRLTLEQNAWRIADYDSSLVAIPDIQSSRVRSMSNGD